LRAALTTTAKVIAGGGFARQNHIAPHCRSLNRTGCAARPGTS
jgi:hypothetical protein